MEQRHDRAIVVGVNLGGQPNFSYSMEELRNLSAACKMEVVGEMTQKADRVNASHYIGAGKLKELSALLEQTEADTVIFNDELSPSQIRNLEAGLKARVIDRTALILDIFAGRAKTREAKLQVKAAGLQYMLPRLIGLGESLGRQGGGAGLKNRGAGETKLEQDRRTIEDKIAALHKELELLKAKRQIQRKLRRRNDVPVVCLVGYTNTGKSSIMNAMLESCDSSANKQVLAQDMLFATLETSVRSIKLPDNKSFLLTDTVGFVSQLPHHLVKAFRSTLEEVAEADLLIHVVDCSNPEYEQHIAVTNETLKELGADSVPTVYAFNKADLTDLVWPQVKGDTVYLSARRKAGIDELAALIRGRLFTDYIQCEMLIPFDQGRLVSYFNDNAHVLSTSYEPDGTKLTVECKRGDFEASRRYVVG